MLWNSVSQLTWFAAVKAAKTVLERNDHMLAQLQDQLALLQFLQGDFKQAEKTALLSLASAQQLETGEGRSLSVAMCQLRLGAILQGVRLRWTRNQFKDVITASSTQL